MRYDEKTVRLRDGRDVVLRSPVGADAADMLEFLKAIAGETGFLLRTPREWADASVDAEASYLAKMADSPDQLMISCWIEGKTVGNCQVTRLSREKTRHRARIAISVKKAYWGLGLGTLMMAEMEKTARAFPVVQLELEVIEGNERALRLYTKCGFERVAALPNAVKRPDGSFAAEYTMIKRLD